MRLQRRSVNQIVESMHNLNLPPQTGAPVVLFHDRRIARTLDRRLRVQGGDLLRIMEKTSPRVNIIQHPDVRRMLMAQKAHVEGMRALIFFAASLQDQVAILGGHGSPSAAADAAWRAAMATGGRPLPSRKCAPSSSLPMTSRHTESSPSASSKRTPFALSLIHI